MAEIPYVNENEFFKISEANQVGPNSAPRLPMTPWVLIQFRTAVIDDSSIEAMNEFLKQKAKTGGYDIARDSKWTTVSFRKRTDGYTPKANISEDMKSNLSGEAHDINGSLKFDNFFEGIDLTDNGGLIECQLKLFDSNFGSLEDIILKTILAMKAGNAYYKNSYDETDTYMLQFHMGAPQNINIRIRYGYADPTVSNENIIDSAEAFTDEFKGRVEEDGMRKMVIRSPWQYFQIMDTKFLVSESGMSAEIKGISIGTSYFDRLKIIQRYSLIRGTPKNVVVNLAKQLFAASSGKIQVVDENGNVLTEDEDKDNELATAQIDTSFKSEWGVTWPVLKEDQLEGAFPNLTAADVTARELDHYFIEVPYGAEPRPQTDRNGRVIPGTSVRDYMTIKSLFNTLCSKVPPIYRYEDDEGEKFLTSPDDVKAIFGGNSDPVETSAGKYTRDKLIPVRYSYTIKEIQVGDKGVIARVRFHYKRPEINQQKFVRKYTWRNNQNNLIKSFGIRSILDFAQMSSSIAVLNGENVTFMAGTAGEGIDVNKVGALAAILYNVNGGDRIQLVQNIVENTEGDGTVQGELNTRTMVQQLADNMNDQVFRGTIEIPGDPFFRFDDEMQPYQYGIYIDVIRDWNPYIQSQDSSLRRSYMSGFYLIKKINHSINKGGFSTTLEVEKWPTNTLELKERRN